MRKPKIKTSSNKGLRSIQYLRGEIELTKYNANGYPHTLEAEEMERYAERRNMLIRSWYK